ncbi:hypothetical protein Cgig2_000816 [Carnegiea gigantea]|uniref:Uncharacterized protein n=1 Tax=Carnegiea gigantea TaxID=171969 RepID=A0A9Q1QJH8_9CARY|nr:hypothetical protein Cgig2_000816 [Carnegiea gigantea]
MKIEKESHTATKQELEYMRALVLDRGQHNIPSKLHNASLATAKVVQEREQLFKHKQILTLRSAADIRVDDDMLRYKRNYIIEQVDGTDGNVLSTPRLWHTEPGEGNNSTIVNRIRRSPHRPNPLAIQISPYVNHDNALGMGKCRMGIVSNSCKQLRKGGTELTVMALMGSSEEGQVGNTEQPTLTIGGIPCAVSEGGEEVIDKSNVVDDVSICSTRETQQQHAPRQDDIPIPSHIGGSDEVVPNSDTSSFIMHEAVTDLQTGDAGSASSEDKLVQELRPQLQITKQGTSNDAVLSTTPALGTTVTKGGDEKMKAVLFAVETNSDPNTLGDSSTTVDARQPPISQLLLVAVDDSSYQLPSTCRSYHVLAIGGDERMKVMLIVRRTASDPNKLEYTPTTVDARQ